MSGYGESTVSTPEDLREKIRQLEEAIKIEKAINDSLKESR
jgi:hypothetical protein